MRLLRLPVSILVLVVVTPTAAADRPPNPRCGEACNSALANVQFTDEDSSLPFSARECGGELLRTSKYLCMRSYCTEKEGNILASELQSRCRDAGIDDIPGMESVEGYTEEDMQAVKRLDKNYSVNEGEELDVAVIPDEEFWGLWFRTLEATKYIYGNNTLYGWYMGVFWALVVGVGMVNKLMALCLQSNKFTVAAESSTWRWMKRTINTPAAFGNRCAQSYGVWCTVPPRVQTLTITLFIVLNVVLSVVGYEVFPGNMYYPAVKHQILRFVSDRTGVISMANFPLIWLFGMRNNVVIWLTGWDFGTYNNFHRWVARVATVQAVIHSIGYTWLIIDQGGMTYFWSWWEQMFWWAGELATIMLSALMGFSVYWLRRSSYEFFLIVHIVLSILILLTMLGHVSIFEGEYDALVWVPAFIWVIDRVVRASRILAFNVQFWNTQAQVSFNESSNMVRLDVPCSSSLYTTPSGTYFFLMVLNKHRFWESHPFTVASTPAVGAGEKDNPNTGGEASPLLESADLADGILPGEAPLIPKVNDGNSLTFLIRPYDSFTGRLKEMAGPSWHKPAPVRVAIEGPYGHTQPFHRFDHVLFVVGGSGIVVPLSYRRRLTVETPRPRGVHVHWTVREPAFAEDVLKGHFEGALSEQMKMDIYLTSGSSAEGEALLRTTASASHGDEDINNGGVASWAHYHMGRVDPRSVVETESENATGSSLAVVACGPAKMADATRKASVNAMAKYPHLRIEYFEESFQW